MTWQDSYALVNRQDHQAPTVGPCKTCPHPQVLEVSVDSVWLCAGATIFHRSFELLFGDFEFSTIVRAFDRILEVSCCLRGFQSVDSKFYRSFAFLIGESGVLLEER